MSSRKFRFLFLFLFLFLAFSLDLALATPPMPFEHIRAFIRNEPDDTLSLSVEIDGPVPLINGVEVKCSPGETISLLGKSELVQNAFPASFEFPLSYKGTEPDYIKIFISPISGEEDYLPFVKTYRLLEQKGDILVEEIAGADLALLTSSIAKKEDRKIILENTRCKSVQIPSGQHEMEQTGEAPTLAGTIAVKGYWYYRDDHGVDLPIRYAKVEVFDSEPFPLPHPLLKTGYTNASGYYYFSGINNDDGVLEGGLDIYVKVHCTYWKNDDKCAYVTDGNITNVSYWSETTVKGDVPDGTVNMGAFTFTDAQKRGCWGIYNSCVTAYEYFKNASPSWDNQKLLCKWPCGDHAYFMGFPWLGLIYEMQISSGYEWSERTIYHEYSHSVMFKMYGNNMPPISHGGEDHTYGSETDEGFAFAEGWADFGSKLIPGEDYFEHNTWADWIDDTDYDGAIVEGAVAEVLWDISDGGSGDDDGIPSKFSYLMTILPKYKPGSIFDIKSAWANQGYSYSGELQEAFYAAKIEERPIETITIDADPRGAVFTVDGLPQQYYYPKDFEWETDSTHKISAWDGFASPGGSDVTKWIFKNWSDGGAQSHDIVADKDKKITAYYDSLHYYRISVFATGATSYGTITITPTPVEAGGAKYELDGDRVDIYATPPDGYDFDYWTGDFDGSTGNHAWISDMDGEKDLTAHYKKEPSPKDVVNYLLKKGGTSYDANDDGRVNVSDVVTLVK